MNEIKSLDEIKKSVGSDKFKIKFAEILNKNKTLAMKLLNNDETSFADFFVLMPVIKNYRLATGLNERNKIAFSLCSQTAEKKKIDFSKYNSGRLAETLEWMTDFALTDDGTNDTYDRLMDICIAKLINEYENENAVKTAVELAFLRNRKNAFNHDLIWAIFYKENISALENIAEHLNSEDKSDKAFSEQLLRNAVGEEIIKDSEDKFESSMKWLKENKSHISFTGESYNLTSRPCFFRKDSEVKHGSMFVMGNSIEDEQVTEKPKPFRKDDEIDIMKLLFPSDKDNKVISKNEWEDMLSPKRKSATHNKKQNGGAV